MGWNINIGQSKQDLIKELIKEEPHRKTIAHSLVGNHLWSVIEMTDNKSGEKAYMILLALIQKHDDDYSYKSMSESMHPYYYTCPIRFLDMSPVACQEWRDIVIANHSRKKSVSKIKINDLVTLSDRFYSKQMQIDSLKPLIARDIKTNQRFKIKKTMIESVNL